MSGTGGIPQRHEDEKDAAREPGQSLRGSLFKLWGWAKHRARSSFAAQVLQIFKESVPVGDEETGPWFATVEAANWDEDDVDQGQISFRFVVSKEPLEPPQEVRSGSLARPRTVTYDFRDEARSQADDMLTVFFTFTDELPLAQNIELFRDFTTLQIKDLQLASLHGKK